MPVILYTTQQFSDLTRAPSWAAGSYDGTIRVPMRGAPENEKEMRKRGATYKRVSNRKLKMESGYCFKYPTFLEGYKAEIQKLGEKLR